MTSCCFAMLSTHLRWPTYVLAHSVICSYRRPRCTNVIENPPLTSLTGMTGVCGKFLSSAFCFALVPLGNSSGADTRRSSNGMGCTCLNQT